MEQPFKPGQIFKAPSIHEIGSKKVWFLKRGSFAISALIGFMGAEHPDPDPSDIGELSLAAGFISRENLKKVVGEKEAERIFMKAMSTFQDERILKELT